MADKGRVLFLSPEPPYPTIGGGALRSASLLEYLRADREVDVLLFRDAAASDPAAAFPADWRGDRHVITLPHHPRHQVARVQRNLSRLIRRVPPLLDRFSGCGTEVSRFLQGRTYDLAIIEHFWCAPYAAQIRPHARRLVLDLHNIESMLHARCGEAEDGATRLAHRQFARYYRRLEKEWLHHFDDLLTTSADDAAYVGKEAPHSRVTVYPNAIPWQEQPKSEPDEAIAFSGNLEFHPNQSAVRYFRQDIWPLLRDRWPALRWRLIGRNPHAVQRYVDGDPRIETVGPVPDALPYLAAAKVAIVPLLAGSGTRFKILEAWAAGVPVVSTRIGAEGLDACAGTHYLLAETPGEFVAAIEELLRSPERRKQLTEAARSYYERCFTWPAAWATVRQIGL